MAPAFSFYLAAEMIRSAVAFQNHAPTIRRTIMPRKPGLNSEFVMFDVLYEDGTQRSNRKVPRALTRRHRRRQAGARFPDRAGPRDRRKIRPAAGEDQEHHPLGREEESARRKEAELASCTSFFSISFARNACAAARHCAGWRGTMTSKASPANGTAPTAPSSRTLPTMRANSSRGTPSRCAS